MKMLIFDIGNTQMKMGIFEGEELVKSWRLTTGTVKTTDEYGMEIVQLLHIGGYEPESLDYVAVSSVVPGVMHYITNAIRNYLNKEPLVIGPGIRTGVDIKVPHPNEVGADIIADVAAATHYYGNSLIVVDFGTATKYEVINDKGALIAAVFSPGIGISAEALTGRAAQLPGFEIKKPDTILTNTTVECMQAGIVYGYIGQVTYIVDQIKKEMNDPSMKVVITGGFGKVLVSELDFDYVYNRTLTLQGVRLIAERNLAKKTKSGKNKAEAGV